MPMHRHPGPERPLVVAVLAASLALAGSGAAATAAPGSPADPARTTTARPLELVGSIELGGTRSTGLHVAAYRNLAFLVGTASPCGSGVRIVDVSDPAAPVLVATTPGYGDTFAAAVGARRIGHRDVLAVGYLACSQLPAHRGLELYDITMPSAPALLGFLALPDASLPVAGSTGVAGLDLLAAPGGRTLAFLAVDGLEGLTTAAGGPGVGDFVVVDVTEPSAPTVVGEWGIRDEPALGSPILLGDSAFSDAVDVRASPSGMRAYVSFYDAGTVVLDVADPTRPRYLGRSSFAATEEGNAATANDLAGGTVVVESTRDQVPFELVFTSPALAGPAPVLEAAAGFTPRIAGLPGREMAGELVHVGRGCPFGSISAGSPADPYLADAHGKIALIERGSCSFATKIARAVLEGATGVVIYNNTAGGDGLTLMVGVSPVTLADGTVVPIDVPAIFIGRTAGLVLRDATPVQVRAEARFNGWGEVRVLSLRPGGSPELVSTYRTPDSEDPELALAGSWTPRAVATAGARAYVAWGSAGLRVVDLSVPAAPREVGAWTGAGAPAGAPPIELWGVTRSGDLVLVADANYGLYILRPAA